MAPGGLPYHLTISLQHPTAPCQSPNLTPVSLMEISPCPSRGPATGVISVCLVNICIVQGGQGVIWEQPGQVEWSQCNTVYPKNYLKLSSGIYILIGIYLVGCLEMSGNFFWVSVERLWDVPRVLCDFGRYQKVQLGTSQKLP